MAKAKKGETLRTRIGLLEAGTKKNIVGKAQINVAGALMNQKQLLAALGAGDALFEAVDASKAQWKADLAALKDGKPGLEKFILHYDAALKGRFGPENVLLAGFGIKPKRAAVHKVQDVAKAVEKGVAKRKAHEASLAAVDAAKPTGK